MLDERDAAGELVGPHETQRRGFEVLVCEGGGWVGGPACEEVLLVVEC